MRFQIEQGRAWADLNFHRRFGGVAHGDLRAELVVLTHQWWQAADDLQVLRGLDRGLSGSKQACCCIGHGNDFEGRQCIIERHRHHGLALRVQLHARVPEQQGVEQFARAAAPTAAAGCHGFSAIVPAANDLHLRG